MAEDDPLPLMIERALAVVLEEQPPDWDMRLERLDTTIRALSEQYQKQGDQSATDRLPEEVKPQEGASSSLESMLNSATAKLVRAQMEYMKQKQQQQQQKVRDPSRSSTDIKVQSARVKKP